VISDVDVGSAGPSKACDGQRAKIYCLLSNHIKNYVTHVMAATSVLC